MIDVSWLLVALALLVAFAIRHPILTLAVPVSLVVYWDFGTIGLGMLWAVLLALAVLSQDP